MSKNATETWMENLKPEDLDLGQLACMEDIEKTFSPDSMKNIKKEMTARREERRLYREKYGAEWFTRWQADHDPYVREDCDELLLMANECIYMGHAPTIGGMESCGNTLYSFYMRRCKELYKNDYAILLHHNPGDSRVVELLLEDAVGTGKWKELPECLQKEYHNRKKI